MRGAQRMAVAYGLQMPDTGGVERPNRDAILPAKPAGESARGDSDVIRK